MRLGRRAWVLIAGGVLLTCVCWAIALSLPRNQATPQQTSPTATDVPATNMPATDIPVVVSSPTPVETETNEQRYLRIAQAAALPVARAAGSPQGEWDYHSLGADDVSITMPLTVGLDNEQTVRLGKQSMAQVINTLFNEFPELLRLNVIGTTPLGDNDAPAISIVVERGSMEWGFVSVDEIGALFEWQVSQRLEN